MSISRLHPILPTWALLPAMLALLAFTPLWAADASGAAASDTSAVAAGAPHSAADTSTSDGAHADDSTAGFWPWVLFGRFHVITVHFPIALLTVVFLLELLRLRRPRQSDATVTIITVLAAISAVVVTVMGWSLASHMSLVGEDEKLIFVHRWLGVVTACLAVVVAALAIMRQLLGAEKLRLTYLITLVLTVVGVSITGHYGGMLVHGESYLPEVIPWLKPKIETPPTHTPTAHSGPIIFEQDIEPIFENTCYKCHDVDDQKGDLRMDTRKDLLAGGKTGPGLVPGNSAKSLIIQRVLGQGGKKRMPKNKPPLTQEQIDLLSRWIDEGAIWAK